MCQGLVALFIAGAAKAESGAFFRQGGEADPAFQVALPQQFDAVGSQAPARSLGGEGALEDLQLHFLRHATLVVYPELQVVAGLLAAEADHSLPGGGLNGILGHVDQDAMQEPRVGEKLSCHGIGGNFHPAGLIVANIVIKSSHLVQQDKTFAGFDLQVQVIFFRRSQGALRLDLVCQPICIAMENVLVLLLFFRTQLFFAEVPT